MESSVVGIYCANNLPKVEQCQGVVEEVVPSPIKPASIPIDRSEPRCSVRENPLPPLDTSVRVGVRVTRSNRQDLDRRYAGFRSLQYFVDEKIIKLGHVLTIGALYFDLAAKMVVVRKRVGPDDTEMTFAIRAHKHLVAFHWNSCIVESCR